MEEIDVITKSFKVGEIIDSNFCGSFKIIKIFKEHPKGEKKARLVNTVTGFTKVKEIRALHSKSIYDPYYPRICGVGFIGEGQYKCRIKGVKTKAYAAWENMLWRVYGEHRLSNRYSGRNASVDQSWHNYQVFADWFTKNYVEGCVLDKDILCPGNVVYGPEFCVFIPQEINKVFSSMNKNRGKYPVGVCYSEKETNKFYTRAHYKDMETGESRTVYKYFATPEQGFAFYKVEKEKIIKNLANYFYSRGCINDTVYNNLINWEIVPFPD